MKRLLEIFFVFTLLIGAIAADSEINPPAPRLIQVDNKHTHIVLHWSCDAKQDVDAFQIMRRVNGVTVKALMVTPNRCRVSRITAKPGLVFFEFEDKKVALGTEYSYSIVLFSDDQSSLESNALKITLTPPDHGRTP